jgi:hypothetical protein
VAIRTRSVEVVLLAAVVAACVPSCSSGSIEGGADDLPVGVDIAYDPSPAKDPVADPGDADAPVTDETGPADPQPTDLAPDPAADDPAPGDPPLADDPGSGYEGDWGEDAPQAGDEPAGGDASLVCNPRTKLVYVVTEQNVLLRFDPEGLAFETVGTLQCAAGPFAAPFSMAIDRVADAWVLYSDGSLFKVSTIDASCETLAFQHGQAGFVTFGMGFASDEPEGETETLFVSKATNGLGDSALGTLAFPSLTITQVAPIPGVGSAELTGNGLAELWGFFPEASPARVARVDKATAALSDAFELPSIANTQAWAFAFWGGNFYLFFKSYADASSSVYRLDPATGDFANVLPKTGWTITGAGVSSCAPTVVP